MDLPLLHEKRLSGLSETGVGGGGAFYFFLLDYDEGLGGFPSLILTCM